MGQKQKVLLWIFIPFIYGYLSNLFLIVIHPFISQIVFGVFWFWIGMKFSEMKGNNAKNFMIGNSVWLISFLMYIWQFILLNDESRNLVFAGLSQHYILGFIWSGAKLSTLFSNVIDGTVVMTLSYLVMFIVFSAGYITQKFRISDTRVVE